VLRKPLILLGFIAAVAAAWWGWSRFSEPPRIVTHAPGTSPSSTSDRGDAAPDPTRDANPFPEPARPTATPERSREPAPSPAPTTTPARELRGTIVGVDESGAKQRGLDGKFTLRRIHEGQVEAYAIEVTKGSWRSGLEPPSEIAIDDIALGDRVGRTPDDTIKVPAVGELELEVELVAPSSLRVVDAATHAPLAGIDVRVDPEWLKGSRLWRDPKVLETPPLVSGATSPVTLPPIGGQPVLWVHVPGYAWARVQVLYLVGGEREVALARGATLEVVLRGRIPEGVALDLVLKREDETWKEPWNALNRESDHETLADIATGPLEVEARVDETVLVTAHAELRAGETTRVELALGDMAGLASKRVPFRGSITGPPESVALERRAMLVQQPPVIVPLAAGHFDFGQVAPGRYVVTIEPFLVHRAFDVGEAGLVDAVIELPALCEVEIEVVDARTGAAIGSPGVGWRTADHPLPELNTATSDFVVLSGSVSRFRAPPGRIVVQAWPEGYAYHSEELDVRPGVNRATLSLEREQYVRVLLQQGSSRVPINPAEHDFDVLREDGKSVKTGWSKEPDSGALKLAVAAPGDYVLRSPRIAGFAPIPDRAVHLEYGGIAEVVIELVRE
jgi:hypothetical protein